MSSVQVIIVGQGFAGSAVAWTLASRGIDFILIDRGNLQTSSRIAAGLVTPITGKRAVKTWEWDVAWKRALVFYPDIERRTSSSFWSVQPSLRLYHSEEERDRIEGLQILHSEMVTPYSPKNDSHARIDQSLGGFLMNEAARLDGSTYLNASLDAFRKRNAYLQHSLDVVNDIHIHQDSIDIPCLGIRARKLVFCQGFSATPNPWFPNLPLVPAQGDILTLDIPNFYESRTIHRNIWLTPRSNHQNNASSSQYLVGSTYRWKPLDGLPTAEARQEILTKLSKWLVLPFEVIDHRSAIRPTSFDQKPLMGKSPLDPRIWVLNGLGAKGTLMAPWCAEQLVDALDSGSDVQPTLNWERRR